MDISIVIPVKDEEESLKKLHQEITSALKSLKKTYEIIIVDDGSTDNSLKILGELAKKDKSLKLIQFRGNFGKSAALKAGFKKAQGKSILTLDADLQDNPNEIPKFLNKLDQGLDLVCGWKKVRHDPLTKVFPSRVYNFLASFLSGVKIHDFNCGFKAYKSEVAKSLVLYGELYRLIPILAAEKKFKITEISIDHRPRKFGRSKYGWERFLKGFLDLITIIFLTRFIRRPAHFFGALGIILLSFGSLIGLYVVYLKLSFGNIQGRTPLLLLGILLVFTGLQLFSTGLLAEMLLHLQQKNSHR